MIDRRGPPRYPIVLVAELRTLDRETTLNGRTWDISRTGCYVDSLRPFSAGTRNVIKLTRANERYETQATVVYVAQSVGMSIAFEEPVPYALLEILDRLIAEAARGFVESSR